MLMDIEVHFISNCVVIEGKRIVDILDVLCKKLLQLKVICISF